MFGEPGSSRLLLFLPLLTTIMTPLILHTSFKLLNVRLQSDLEGRRDLTDHVVREAGARKRIYQDASPSCECASCPVGVTFYSRATNVTPGHTLCRFLVFPLLSRCYPICPILSSAFHDRSHHKSLSTSKLVPTSTLWSIIWLALQLFSYAFL